MTQVEQIKAEIERLKKELKDLPGNDYKDGVFYVLEEELTPFINSLTVEQSNELFCWNDMTEEEKADFFFDLSHQKQIEQSSEYLEYLATSLEETIGTSPHSRETIISYLQQAAQWQKEQIINKACEWLRYCVDVNDEVKMIDGEPEAESLVQKNLHRIKMTNQIVEDFKKAMEDG